MKLQSTTPDAAGNAAPGILSDDPAKALLNSLAGLAGERALILGLDIEIMCGLIQRGCREVTEVEPGDRPDPASVDLVVVPAIATEEAGDRAIALARRGLTDLGRIVVRTARAPSEHLIRAIPETLERHGFLVTQLHRGADRTAFAASLTRQDS